MTLNYHSQQPAPKPPGLRPDWLNDAIGQVRPLIGALYIYSIFSILSFALNIALFIAINEKLWYHWLLLGIGALDLLTPISGYLIAHHHRIGVPFAWAAVILIFARNTLTIFAPCVFIASLVVILPFIFCIVRGLLSRDLRYHFREGDRLRALGKGAEPL